MEFKKPSFFSFGAFGLKIILKKALYNTCVFLK
jgi:hypothetical protein